MIYIYTIRFRHTSTRSLLSKPQTNPLQRATNNGGKTAISYLTEWLFRVIGYWYIPKDIGTRKSLNKVAACTAAAATQLARTSPSDPCELADTLALELCPRGPAIFSRNELHRGGANHARGQTRAREPGRAKRDAYACRGHFCPFTPARSDTPRFICARRRLRFIRGYVFALVCCERSWVLRV